MNNSVPEVTEKPVIYKPINPNAKWFKCRDCGEMVHYFERNPYGASYHLLATLHRCSLCVNKIAHLPSGNLFYDLCERVKQKFGIEV